MLTDEEVVMVMQEIAKVKSQADSMAETHKLMAQCINRIAQGKSIGTPREDALATASAVLMIFQS